MSTLKALLKDVPVEWKDLGDVLIRAKGTKITAEQMKVLHKDGAPIKIFAGGKTVAFFNYEDIPEKDINFNPSIIVKSRGIIEFEFYDKPFSHKNEMWSYYSNKNEVNIKYVYYLLKINEQYFQNIGNRMQMPQISTPVTDKFKIPIPHPNDPEKSLEIQQEIVRFLDGLSVQNKVLTTALAKEIGIRKKQYEYYREELFRFEGKLVGWKKISEIGTFQRGKRFVRTDMISHGVPCIHYGEMYTHYGFWAKEAKSFLNEELVSSKKLRFAEKNDVVIVAAGETIEDIGKGTAWLGEEGVVIHDACFLYKSSLNPVYFAYFTRTRLFHDQIRRNISSGKISAINEKGFNKVIIPVPSIEEQQRIVHVLDHYDKATINIVAQLKKEIDLRNKQYEYYRNSLLNFPKN